MPTRTFTRKNIVWKVCEACGEDFPASRKDRRYCDDECRRAARRLRNREAVIASQGNRCADCPKTYDSQHPTPFYVLKDQVAVCGSCLVKRSQAKFWTRWPKGQKGYVCQKRGHST